MDEAQLADYSERARLGDWEVATTVSAEIARFDSTECAQSILGCLESELPDEVQGIRLLLNLPISDETATHVGLAVVETQGIESSLAALNEKIDKIAVQRDEANADDDATNAGDNPPNGIMENLTLQQQKLLCFFWNQSHLLQQGFCRHLATPRNHSLCPPLAALHPMFNVRRQVEVPGRFGGRHASRNK